MTLAAAKPSGRLGYLDALRGLAAISVCLNHFVGHLAEGTMSRSVLEGAFISWFDAGRFGVILFFLISGFVIPFSLKGENAIPHFAISRLFRLYPAYWLSIVGTMVAALLLSQPLPSLQTVAANLTMTPKLFGQDYVSGVFWTLFIELNFYVLCVVLFVTKILQRPLTVFAIALAASSAALLPALLNLAKVSHLPVPYISHHLAWLITGYLLRLGIFEDNVTARRASLALVILQLTSMPVLAFSGPGQFVTHANPFSVTVGALAATVVFAVAITRAPQRVPRFALLLGAWSYSIYLFHVQVGFLLKAVFKPTGELDGLLFMAAALALTAGFSAFVYRWLETPANDLGRRINHQRRRTLAMEVAP